MHEEKRGEGLEFARLRFAGDAATRRGGATRRDETRRVRLGDGEELLGWAHDEADPVVN